MRWALNRIYLWAVTLPSHSYLHTRNPTHLWGSAQTAFSSRSGDTIAHVRQWMYSSRDIRPGRDLVTMPKAKRKAEDELCEILWDVRMCNSVSHFYTPIPEYASTSYRWKTVKVTTETGKIELKVGDRMIYKGRQVSYPEDFDYSSLKPGDKV